jgi:hypothetical protein
VKEVIDVKYGQFRHNLHSQIRKIMTQKKVLKKESRPVTVDGLMTIGKLDNNLNLASFQPTEYVEVAPCIGRFKVQILRNGVVYLEQLAKRIRNSPLFRLAHSSLSYGRNAIYYYNFYVPDSELERIPDLLELEAHEAAERLRKMIGEKGGKK